MDCSLFGVDLLIDASCLPAPGDNTGACTLANDTGLNGFGPPADGVIGAGSALGVVEFPLPPRGMLFCVGDLEAICWVVGDPKLWLLTLSPGNPIPVPITGSLEITEAV